MSKILDIVRGMGTRVEITDSDGKIVNRQVSIDCTTCGRTVVVKVGAVYRQHNRSHDQYICKSCAGKRGWTKEMRESSGDHTREKWTDPAYAGKISGKAVARQIIKELENAGDFPPLL